MNSDSSGRDGSNGSELPPHLDPRGGRPRRSDRHQRGGGQQSNQQPRNQQPGGLPPQLDPRGRSARRAAERRTRTRGATARGVLLGVKIVAAAMSLAVVLGSGWAWATYRSFNSNIKRLQITSSSSAGAKNIDGSDQNILIVGNDDRQTATNAELAQLGTTRDGGSLNTDTMMLLHVPANGSKATVISFPRDSYVDIPGYGKNKLNSAYPDGFNDAKGSVDDKRAAGASLLETTIENLTGLKIDHFVQVDLLGFYRISNAIQGVTVCLNEGARGAKYVGETGNGIDSGYEPDGSFVKDYTNINLPPGKSTIQGLQALAFVRQRHGLPNGDLDRIKRQQYFLSAVFRKLVSGGTLLNPIKLQNLLKAITSSLTMDQSLDPIKLAQQMQNLSAGNVSFTTIPTSGFDDNTPAGSVVVVNTAAMPDFINRLIGNSSADAYAKAKAADPSTVTVSVVNDTNSNGLEQTNAAALGKLGFQTTIPAPSSDVVDKTVIKYPKGSEAAAKALAAAVPGAAVQQSGDVSGVTLVLGNNGVQVKTLMPAPTTHAPTSAAAPSPAPTSSDGTVTTNAAQAGCIN
ncbi:MAG TPA: LCP family protein [Jatrophihabitans sp.]|nr:LCP family protein [Jatrophihabitans sp.]